MTKDFQTMTKLVNRAINETLQAWAGNEDALRTYAIRHCGDSEDMVEIQPTHGQVFYGIENYIEAAEVCDCSYYVDVQPNLNGVLTPTLHIF